MADQANLWSKAPIPAYRTSKAALNMLMLYYANPLRDKAFKVNASCPGYIGIDLNDCRGKGTTSKERRILFALLLWTRVVRQGHFKHRRSFGLGN
ncbi:hypothetical protein BDW59DRAFT_142542 [Aspergillus cavernicola]|uniref:Uncharacterized protein n=1 Tax=Aspergillus cavernicola TaxID=176166 RepID=A0ABR4IME6_9EURO